MFDEKDLIEVMDNLVKRGNLGYIMEFYSKKSFRYNKVIQWMLQDMKRSSLIDVDDQYKLLLDNVSLDKVEEENFKTWLKNHIAGVISLDMADSKNYYFLQIADLIAGIPKLTGKNPIN